MNGIVSGKSRFLKDYYSERAREEGRWGKQRRKGEKAREIESERKDLWSLIGTGVALAFGMGPASIAIGTAVGKFAGGVGTWDDGKRIEDIGFMDENVGKFERQQIDDIRAHNQGLKDYDKEEFWASITDIGTSIASSYSMAGSGAGDTWVDAAGKTQTAGFDWTTWGSEKGGRTTSELWKNFFNRPKI